MSDSNGKWQIGFWVIAVLVVGAFTWTTTCYMNNRYGIEKLEDRFIALKEVSNDCLHQIDKRLSRIEERLAIQGPL